jgi:hypothetical protein
MYFITLIKNLFLLNLNLLPNYYEFLDFIYFFQKKYFIVYFYILKIIGIIIINFKRHFEKYL